MRTIGKIFTIVASVFFWILSANVIASNSLQQVCSVIPPEDKLVINFYDSRYPSVHVCGLNSYILHGANCSREDYWENSGYSEVIDLNGDGFFDVILRYSSGGIWRANEVYLVLANCGDNTYVEIKLEPEPNLLQSIQKSHRKPGEWLKLRGAYMIPNDYDDGSGNYSGMEKEWNIQEFEMVFDPKDFVYRIGKKGKIRQMEESDTQSFMTNGHPPEFKPPWGSFPTIKVKPSFDCVWASTVVEKLICDNNLLSYLDTVLSRHYAKLKAIILEDSREQLLTDQRNWIKQSRACKDTQCLSIAYVQRIGELCQRYPVKSGKQFVCDW